MRTTAVNCDRVDTSVEMSGPGCRLTHLSDDELLDSTRRLVGKSNQILAALLAHLAEVESRGIHRSKACSSLYTYCIYELRFSEDAASRRVCAARLVKRFPALLEAVANGELHLTGLLMLGPYFTAENQLDLLSRAKFRTKKELAKLVRILDPLPDIPGRIIPLGPAQARGGSANASPTWNAFAHSLCPPVRELGMGDRPKDWVNQADDDWEGERLDADLAPGSEGLSAAPAREGSGSEGLSAAPARGGAPGALTAPQRYQVQFTASEEHVQLIERAQALLPRPARNVGLAELYLRALVTLVAELEKGKFGAARPRRRSASQAAESAPEAEGAPPTSRAPRPRVRHVPAVERRMVFDRDGARCSFVDARGQRCRETRSLELHHLVPFALDGADASENLAILCQAHNALAAEEDFGRRFIEAKRDEVRHEPWLAQERR